MVGAVKAYTTTIACSVCKKTIAAETFSRGKLTPDGMATLKAAGWRFVVAAGLWCADCQQRERELEDRALHPSSALPGPNPARQRKEAR